jgi:hypothetical protein
MMTGTHTGTRAKSIAKRPRAPTLGGSHEDERLVGVKKKLRRLSAVGTASHRRGSHAKPQRFNPSLAGQTQVPSLKSADRADSSMAAAAKTRELMMPGRVTMNTPFISRVQGRVGHRGEGRGNGDSSRAVPTHLALTHHNAKVCDPVRLNRSLHNKSLDASGGACFAT